MQTMVMQIFQDICNIRNAVITFVFKLNRKLIEELEDTDGERPVFIS